MSVLSSLCTVLSDAGVEWLAICPESQVLGCVGLRDEDWDRALTILRRSIGGLLLGFGLPGAEAGTFSFRAEPSATSPRSDIGVACAIVPGFVERDDRVIKRFGFECAVRLVRWRSTDGGMTYEPTEWNSHLTSVNAPDFGAVGSAERTAEESLAGELSRSNLMEAPFPIDAVYTWVDGTDPAWLERKRKALENSIGEPMPEDAAADLRFVGHDELRHSLRALELYAPWIRHVYVVTDGQRPEWLREDSDWVSVVDHRQIAPSGTSLPTFNSQAIEANIHRIEGLSEHFLYFNDDMFLSSPVEPDLFFHANGLASMYLSRAQVAPGEPVEGEPAPDAAGKNARRLVEEVCGRRLSRKLFHAPYALRRSVSYEIEQRWPEIVQRTRDSQFRRLEDITLAGGLHLNYAYATARAVTRKIRYRYVGIGEHTAAGELDRLIADRHTLQTFCLNDAVQELPPDVVDRQVRSFLARRFPDIGSFENIPG